MRKLIELRTGLVHADGNEIVACADSYTLCGLDTTCIEPQYGAKFTEDEIQNDLCPAMVITSRRITCPSCLGIAKFILDNSREFKAAIRGEGGAE